jgi:hypothetical protein
MPDELYMVYSSKNPYFYLKNKRKRKRKQHTHYSGEHGTQVTTIYSQLQQELEKNPTPRTSILLVQYKSNV